jgi:hypothetical protein
MSASLANFLKDFGAAPEPTAFAQPEPPAHDFDFGDDMLTLPQPVVDIEAERREAFEQGRKAATEEADTRHAAEIDKLKSDHAEEMAKQRREHDAELARLLGEALPAVTAQLTEALVDQAVTALSPVVRQEVAKQAVEDLAATLKIELKHEVAAQMEIVGPAELLSQLRDALGEAADGISFVEDEAEELTLRMGDAVVTTQLAEFATEIQRILA